MLFLVFSYYLCIFVAHLIHKAMKQKVIKLVVQTIISFLGALCAMLTTTSCSALVDCSRDKTASPNEAIVHTPQIYGAKVTKDSLVIDSVR